MVLTTLRTTADFERVFAEKKKFFKDGLGFHVKITGSGGFRLGLVTPKRFGKAVERNQFRRRVRELLRRSLLPVGADLVVSVYKPLKEVSFEVVKRTIRWALDRVRRMPSTGEVLASRPANPVS